MKTTLGLAGLMATLAKAGCLGNAPLIGAAKASCAGDLYRLFLPVES